MRAETQAPGERRQRDEEEEEEDEEDDVRRRRRRLEKERRRRRPPTAGHLWPSSPCQQGTFTTLLPGPNPSCFPRVPEAKGTGAQGHRGTGSGQRNATAMCEKAQQGEHEELGKIAKD